MADEAHHPKFTKLIDFLARVPAVEINDTPSRGFGSGEDGGTWWVKFTIDIDHELALNRLTEETSAADILTAREFEVLSMLLAERSTDEIANLLHLSPKTVANLHSLIKSKLGVGSDIELVRLALKQGILNQGSTGT